MHTRRSAILGIALLVVLFFGVNILSDIALKGARLDLTQHKLFTVSDGTRGVIDAVEEPVSLTLYYSESLASGRPSLQAYGKRVRELLEEFDRRGGSKIELTVLDPEPFSDAEDRARRDGIAGLPIAPGQEFFFGLAGTNSTDGREVIPFFEPGEERFLEFEISRLIYKLSNPDRPLVGVLSSLALDGSAPVPGIPPEANRPWQIMRELRELFEVRLIDPGVSTIEDDIELLLIVHPKGLSEGTLRAIDAFVIAGGPTVVCVDPMCEMDIPPGAAQNPSALFQADRGSDLDRLLNAWGLDTDSDSVVLDMTHALRGRSPDGRQTVPYPQYLGIPSEALDSDDPVTLGMSRIQLALATRFSTLDEAATTWTPLIQSSTESMTMPGSRFNLFADPQQIVSDFASSETRMDLAGRLSGVARSAFADSEDLTAQASGEIRVVVIGDVDMFADRWWVEEFRLGGMLLGHRKLSDNADFLVNIIDNLAGSKDLMRIRARGTFARPFTLVNEIRSQAEQRYLAEAQSLEQRRRETERRLAELQRARPDTGDLILTDEQEAELAQFREELADTNAQLRDVRFSLRKDVEQLGLTLKIVNTLAAPILVAIGAVGLGLYRSSRRTADRKTMAGKG